MSDNIRPIDLNLAAAKKRKSAQTGFIHHCYASLPGDSHDTIPLYENFCYALALLRTRLSDHVLEAKALLEKLNAFEVGGNFPIYLHEYPECKDRALSIRILPVLFWVLRDFRLVLGDALCAHLEGLLQRIVIHTERIHAERPLALNSWVKWKAIAEPHLILDQTFLKAADLADYLIALQIAQTKGAAIEKSLQTVCSKWHAGLRTFLGLNLQERSEPEVTLFDLFLGHFHGSYAPRVFIDHPIHLQAALVHSIGYDSASASHVGSFAQVLTEDSRYIAFWADATTTHSLFCDPRNSSLHANLSGSGAQLQFTLADNWEPSEQPEMPLSLFCNLSDAHTVWINGQKATTFQLGDQVEIRSENQKITIQFSCVEGEGVFFGHLLRGNRPTQKSCVGSCRFDAHDWQLAIRTVRRSPRCQLAVKIDLHQKQAQNAESFLQALESSVNPCFF